MEEPLVPAPKIIQEQPERAPGGWREVQDSIAASSGLSMLLVDGIQPPALVVSNNNSICQALQSSAEHVRLCDPYCGEAHRRAMSAGTITHYRCHAGLQCFAMPVELDNRRQLAVIGGRAFVTSADYRATAERFREGDLHELLSTDLFSNVIFASEQDLDHAAMCISEAAKAYEAKTDEAVAQLEINETKKEESRTVPEREELHVEVSRLRGELERRTRFADSVQSFTQQIDSVEPQRSYASILNQSTKLLRAERGSLWAFNEDTHELAVKAAVGMPDELSEIGPIHIGEGISGSVISKGEPLVVRDLEEIGKAPAPAARQYKTNSFISFPIKLGDRRIGLLNVTDKAGGGAYDDIDLSLIESIAPQMAMALDRAEWQEKATQFQLMSITDPLTGLLNRRYLEERLNEELSRSKRYGYPMSFMMIDIDDFKHYNDRNGHQAGDHALQLTAHCLKSSLRLADVASRYGGEEFCILLPQTALDEAAVIAERIRQMIHSTPYPNGKGQPQGAVTASIGLSSFSRYLDTPATVIRAADRALYHAKSHGKNRIVAYQDPAKKGPAGESGNPG
ncbi:MAG TPA: diguanylate cyclase [Pyrinomonadaceae bacterium]|jgi:diguanylate cyclase (GGDEF)-like protein